MKKKDIFIGPIIRRVEPDLVVIQIATFKECNLKFSVRSKYTEEWLGHDKPKVVPVLTNLFFYFGRIRPLNGKKFPSGKLLEYSIAVTDKDGNNPDYTFFEIIAKEEKLTYNNHILPSFFIQSPNQKLKVLYGSCRKIHDDKGGKIDALRGGDDLLNTNINDINMRPAILCLGGDQIYADDVHDDVFQECTALANKISNFVNEKSPAGELPKLPSVGKRSRYVSDYAKFTSGESKNHLVQFSEYLAMYGLTWNLSNWISKYSDLSHFTISLPKIRRLFANIPTYMIFDDHDVTDDWNLSLNWKAKTYNYLLGRRIISNALAAFWLCQGYGNDPIQYDNDNFNKICTLISEKEKQPKIFDDAFWKVGNKQLLDKWEFSTPTFPFIYFLDTRTNRGHTDLKKTNPNGPPFLKSIDSWSVTIKKLSTLLNKQKPHYPLILVAPAPIFGFSIVDNLQKFGSAILGPSSVDFEGWSANAEHLVAFLRMMGDKNVIVLSGDVHYSFTSTVKFTVFDDPLTSKFSLSKLPDKGLRSLGLPWSYRRLHHAKFIQLNSSALKNFASDIGIKPFANRNDPDAPGLFLTEDNRWVKGKYQNDEFYYYSEDIMGQKHYTKVKPELLKPSCLIKQGINNVFNSKYIGEHNIGFLTVSETEITNCFFTPSGKESERTWNFSNDQYWDLPYPL